MDEERLVVALEARIRDFEKQMQKAERTGTRSYQNLAKGSRSATRQMEADMNRSTGIINKALAATTAQVGVFAKAFAAGRAGGIVGAGLAGFVASAKMAAAGVAEIGAEARRAGVSTKVFQELKHVADSYKVSVDALTDGLKEMSLRADEFISSAGKSGSAAEAFKRLGYSAEELREKLKDPSALFTEIIGKLGKFQKASQIRIADEIFGGTGGEQFVQLIDRGADGIRRATKEAHDLGLVLNDDVITRAEEIDREFNLISQTVSTNLKGAIVSATAALREFIDSFRAVENQQTRTLQGQLASLGARRLEIENKILEVQKAQREETEQLSDVAKNLGFEDSKNELLAGPTGKIAALNEDLREIIDQEKEILKVLEERRKTLGQDNAGATTAQPLEEIVITDERKTKALEDQATAYQRLIESAQQRLEQMRLEIGLVGENAHQADGLRFTLDMLQSAMADGKTITEEQRREIEALGEQYGILSEQIAAVQAMDGIQFDREQLGRTREEQQVYAEIRNIGLDINTAKGQQIADEIRITQKLDEQRAVAEEIAGIFAGMFSGPIDDADDFFNKLLSGFARIGEANIQKTFENLLGPAAGGASSGAGFLDQIGEFVGGIFTSRKMTQAQNKAIDTAAAKIPAEPLVQAMSKVGGAVSQTTSSVTSSITNYAAAIRKIESGSYEGNYGAMGPPTRSGDRAYGAYQVMGANVPSWTKELLGQSVSIKDFLQDKSLQDRVFYQQFGKSLDKFGNFSDAASVWFSGQPLSVARNRSDGFNTTEQYVQKATNALGNLKTDVSAGAEIGVTQGIKKAATASLSADPQGGPGSVQPGTATGGWQQGLNAVIGGLGTGYQAQDPLMGGISGFLGGLATGNPIAAVAGGIAGLKAGKFGAPDKRRKIHDRNQRILAA